MSFQRSLAPVAAQGEDAGGAGDVPAHAGKFEAAADSTGATQPLPAKQYPVYRPDVPNRSLADPGLRAGTTRLLHSLLD